MPTRTTAEWVDVRLAADIRFGECKGPNDLLEDPHLETMGMFPVVDHPSEGKIRLLGFPISFSETPCRLRRLPPQLGEHGPDVLRELGFDAYAIAAMGYPPQHIPTLPLTKGCWRLPTVAQPSCPLPSPTP